MLKYPRAQVLCLLCPNNLAGFEVLFEVLPVFLYGKDIRCTKSLGNTEL